MSDREHLDAAIEARRELGPEYEPQLVESFLERIDKEIDRRVEQRLARRTGAGERGPEFVITLTSLGVAIPLLGIAGGTSGLAGVIVVCVALVLLNLVVRLR